MNIRRGTYWGAIVMGIVASLPLSPASAEEVDVRARASIEPAESFVGQRVSIRIDVLTSEFFTSQPGVRVPQVADLAILPDPISQGPTSTTIDGQDFSGVTFEFAAFPLRAGTWKVPPFAVTVAGPPVDGVAAELHPAMDELKLSAIMPPGAENLAALICTPELTVDGSWQPPLATATVGDAFTRTVRMAAPDLVGMVLPPLPQVHPTGVAIYSQQPQVVDHIERGILTGQRTESITYVCQQPGTFRLPETVIPWWDTDDRTLKQAKLPAVTFVVSAPPQATGVPAATSLARPWPRARWIAAVVALAAAFGVARRSWRRRGRHSDSASPSRERELLERLYRGCMADDAGAAYRDLLAWFGAIHPSPDPPLLSDMARSAPRLAHSDLLMQLEAAVLDPQQPWNGRLLWKEIRSWRRAWLDDSSAQGTPRLPPLNGPSSAALVARD